MRLEIDGIVVFQHAVKMIAVELTVVFNCNDPGNIFGEKMYKFS